MTSLMLLTLNRNKCPRWFWKRNTWCLCVHILGAMKDMCSTVSQLQTMSKESLRVYCDRIMKLPLPFHICAQQNSTKRGMYLLWENNRWKSGGRWIRGQAGKKRKNGWKEWGKKCERNLPGERKMKKNDDRIKRWKRRLKRPVKWDYMQFEIKWEEKREEKKSKSSKNSRAKNKCRQLKT